MYDPFELKYLVTSLFVPQFCATTTTATRGWRHVKCSSAQAPNPNSEAGDHSNVQTKLDICIFNTIYRRNGRIFVRNGVCTTGMVW